MSYRHPCRGDDSQPFAIGAYDAEVGQTFDRPQILTGLGSHVARLIPYARLISERPQMQVQSLLDALLRGLKQADIDGNCLR